MRRHVRRTGIKVSPYALGGLMFATAIGNPDHADSIRVIHKALDAVRLASNITTTACARPLKWVSEPEG